VLVLICVIIGTDHGSTDTAPQEAQQGW